MTEQNRRYVTKEIGKLLSEIWRTLFSRKRITFIHI